MQLIRAENPPKSTEPVTAPKVSLPMLMGPTTGEISICWAIDNPSSKTKGWVEYGYDRDKLDQKCYSAIQGFTDYGRIKNVRLKGLDPQKMIYYRCCLKSAKDTHDGWMSQVYRYNPILLPEKKMKFAVINDTHLNHEVIQKAMARSKAFGSDFICWNGDIFNSITKEQDLIDQIFMGYPAGMAQETPLVVPRGNHDCRGGAAKLFGQAIGRPNSDVFYYHYRVGDVAFIILDTTEDKGDDRLRSDAAFDQVIKEQVHYLKSLTSNPLIQNAKKKVVLCHIPLWTTKDWGRPYTRDLWLEQLQANGIDLIISGHTHAYEFIQKNTPKEKLTHPVRDPNPPSNPIPQLIGGGPKTNRATVILGEWIKEKLHIRMEDLNGKKIVSFSI